MIDQLTAEDFQPHLNEHFTVLLEDGEPYILQLAQVQFVGEPWKPGARRPFSLCFSHPRRDAYLPQRIYCLEHPEMGAMDVFLVPLGPDQTGMRYEVIFS